MCGLSGVLSTTISDGEFDKFCQLFNVSSLRGEHSSGLFSVKELSEKKKKPSYSVRFMKGVGSSRWFTEHNWKGIKEHVHDSSDTVLVAGHCRHATRGSVSSANAHPFNFSNLIGMHNGTLMDNIGPKVPKNNGKKNKNGMEDTETDSESFYRYLNDHTIEEALAELKPYSDAYAFVWYDKRDKTLNFLRNNKRPLWFGQTNNNTLYWASEKEFLQFILNRNYGSGYSNNLTKLAEIPADTLISFDVTAASPVQACTVRKIEVKHKTNYGGMGHNSGYLTWGRYGFSEYGESEGYAAAAANRSSSYDPLKGNDEVPFDKASGIKPTIAERVATWKQVTGSTEKSNVITLPNVRTHDKDETTYNILGKEFSKEDYQRKLERGCAWCTCQSDTAEKVFWFASDDYLCEACSSDAEVMQFVNQPRNA